VYRSSPRTVIYEDSPSVVYRTPTDAAFWNGVWTARVEAAVIAASAAYAYNAYTEFMEYDEESDGGLDADTIDFERELKDTRALVRELEAEFIATDSLVRAIDKPVDGRYSGETAEDDGGDQSVHTTLTFGRDGRVSGEGYDGVDGAYVIREGRWSQKRVAWVEEYDEGFSVALRGQVRPDGTIVALWASSVGVGGSVTLAAPPRP